MSRTIRSSKTRKETTIRLEDKYIREDAEGYNHMEIKDKRELKRFAHKHNRRVGKRDSYHGQEY